MLYNQQYVPTSSVNGCANIILFQFCIYYTKYKA